jgi:hypothetical protein
LNVTDELARRRNANSVKLTMFDEGAKLVREFCTLNDLPIPGIQIEPTREWVFGVCAYYRPIYIKICLERCAHIGTGGQQWSYPGYVIDRTPYGVLAHELGHHADMTRSVRKRSYFGDYSEGIKAKSLHDFPLTSYAPNDGEWFAEMFRLFVTNPDLLRLVRPRVYELLRADFTPLVQSPWLDVLHDAPGRTIRQAAKKIDDAAKWYATPGPGPEAA